MARYSDDSMGSALAKGALAGLVAGASVLVARRLQNRGILEPEKYRMDRWERTIRRAARDMGFHLTRRGTDVAAATTYLGYAAALGALFGIARVRLPLSVSAKAMLESSLVFAASLPFSGILEERKRQKRPPRRSIKRPRLPFSPVKFFGPSAGATFERLASR